MKNPIIAGFVFGVLIAPAVAADMPLKAPPPPPPEPVYYWTGCHLGGSIGAVWRQSDSASISFVDGGSGVAAGAIPTAFNDGGIGWIGGGQVGCNHFRDSGSIARVGLNYRFY